MPLDQTHATWDYNNVNLKIATVRNNNHAVPRSHYTRWVRRREWPSGSWRTAPPTADRTLWTEGPQSWPALASPSSTGVWSERSNKGGGGWGRGRYIKGWQWIKGRRVVRKRRIIKRCFWGLRGFKTVSYKCQSTSPEGRLVWFSEFSRPLRKMDTWMKEKQQDSRRLNETF